VGAIAGGVELLGAGALAPGTDLSDGDGAEVDSVGLSHATVSKTARMSGGSTRTSMANLIADLQREGSPLENMAVWCRA
jgi:hypothetical protein